MHEFFFVNFKLDGTTTSERHLTFSSHWSSSHKMSSIPENSETSITCTYTCRIAVGIPKTAIGVTAILLTGISETAMAAKN